LLLTTMLSGKRRDSRDMNDVHSRRIFL
jgi:hypothetical protein